VMKITAIRGRSVSKRADQRSRLIVASRFTIPPCIFHQHFRISCSHYSSRIVPLLSFFIKKVTPNELSCYIHCYDEISICLFTRPTTYWMSVTKTTNPPAMYPTMGLNLKGQITHTAYTNAAQIAIPISVPKALRISFTMSASYKICS